MTVTEAKNRIFNSETGDVLRQVTDLEDLENRLTGMKIVGAECISPVEFGSPLDLYLYMEDVRGDLHVLDIYGDADMPDPSGLIFLMKNMDEAQ